MKVGSDESPAISKNYFCPSRDMVTECVMELIWQYTKYIIRNIDIEMWRYNAPISRIY